MKYVPGHKEFAWLQYKPQTETLRILLESLIDTLTEYREEHWLDMVMDEQVKIDESLTELNIALKLIKTSLG